MKHKLIKLISVIVIAVFAMQSLAWGETAGLHRRRISLRWKNYLLRPRAAGEKWTWKNGEILQLDQKDGLLIIGDTATGKSSLAIAILNNDNRWKAVSCGSSLIRVAHVGDKPVLLGSRHIEDNRIYSRFFGVKEVNLSQDKMVRIKWVVALDHTFDHSLENMLGSDFSAQDLGVEVIKAYGVDTTYQQDIILGQIYERQQEPAPSAVFPFPREEDKRNARQMAANFADDLNEKLQDMGWDLFSRVVEVEGRMLICNKVTVPFYEAAVNIMTHGNGGEIRVYYNGAQPRHLKKLTIIAVDNGPGIEDPNKLLQDSIVVHSDARYHSRDPIYLYNMVERGGLGLRNIAIYTQRLTCETNGRKYVKQGRISDYGVDFEDDEVIMEASLRLADVGPSLTVEKGTRFTMEWLSSAAKFETLDDFSEGKTDEILQSV